MANRTDPLAKSVHGTNPQNLIEQILRSKIYQCQYWKETCFGLNSEILVDKAIELDHIGGSYGGQRKPTNFICLIEKMLQIQPDKEITVEFIKNEDYKYVRLLGAFYLRLVGKAIEVYQYLEPLYNDYRKIRVRLSDGSFALTHVDEVIDDMLRKDYLFDIALPHLPLRLQLERSKLLEPRISVLAEDFDEEALEAEAGDADKAIAQLEAQMDGRERNRDSDYERSRRHRSRSHSRDRHRHSDDYVSRRSRRHEERERDKDRNREKTRERTRQKDKHEKRKRRSKTKSPSSRKQKKKSAADEADDIAEQNALRASLGLKPLK